MMEENPFSKSTQPIFFEERNDRCRCLSEEEIRKLLAACPAYLRNIVQVALLTGLRKNDLLRLKWSDIGLERRILYFKEQKKRGKRGGAKVLNGDLADLLRKIGQNGSEYVFNAPNGKPLDDVKKVFRTALKKAGIADFRFHDLSHASAPLIW